MIEPTPGAEDLEALSAEAAACTLCAEHLPLGPRPVFRVSTTARLLIVGQAPGTKVHETGIPWNDPSGDRLRLWMGISRDAFYDHSKIGILPTGFCYPGRLEKGGDAPPRPECAPLWQARFLAAMPQVETILLVGSYAQAFHLGKTRQKTMTETVRAALSYGPRFLPTPHPSWRTTAWQKKNPWFEAEILPVLQERVAALTA
ncbi:MAG: uracil-DNA glycosylase family protein [Rhodospirillaceae bacterium]